MRLPHAMININGERDFDLPLTANLQDMTKISQSNDVSALLKSST